MPRGPVQTKGPRDQRRRQPDLASTDDVGAELIERYGYTLPHAVVIAHAVSLVPLTQRLNDLQRWADRCREGISSLADAVTSQRSRDTGLSLQLRELFAASELVFVDHDVSVVDPEVEWSRCCNAIITAAREVLAFNEFVGRVQKTTLDAVAHRFIPEAVAHRPENQQRSTFVRALITVFEPEVERPVEPMEVALLAAFYGIDGIPLRWVDRRRRANKWSAALREARAATRDMRPQRIAARK